MKYLHIYASVYKPCVVVDVKVNYDFGITKPQINIKIPYVLTYKHKRLTRSIQVPDDVCCIIIQLLFNRISKSQLRLRHNKTTHKHQSTRCLDIKT